MYKQNNKGSNYERGIICTRGSKGLFITEKNMSINPLYSWIPLAHFHKPIINWLRRKLNRAKLMEETMRKKRK